MRNQKHPHILEVKSMLKQKSLIFQKPNVEWRDIPGYPNYIVSNDGRVYNKERDRFLSPDNRGDVVLYNAAEGSKSWAIHVLMGCVFLGNDIDDVFRNRTLFKDGNSSNRNLSNLYIEDTSDLPGEKWKPLREAVGKKLKNHYEISNLGRVRSLKHYVEAENHSKVVKKPYPTLMVSCVPGDKGYKFAYLACEDGSSVNAQVHRLVAAAFCENADPEHNNVVNHLDGDPRNNRADNLEWTTHSGNAQHAISTGLRGDWKGRKLRYGVVNLNTGMYYNSLSDLDRAIGKTVGYCSNRLDAGKPILDAEGNEIRIQVLKNVEQKIHTDGQHCKLSTFPGREFCSLSEASVAIGRWEGYIGDALNRGGVIRDLSGKDVKVELIGAAPCIERSREALAKRKAAGLVSDKKERKSSEWASHKPLRHVETGQVFASMSDASRAMGKKAGYLSDCFAFDRTPVDASGNVWTFEQVDEDVKMERKEYYDRNKCYVEEYPGKEFGSLTLLSKEIGRDQGYVADRVQRGKPVLHIDGTQLHLHFADAAKEEEYQKKVAKCMEEDSKPKQRMTKFACYFEEDPNRIFSNFSEAAFSLGKGASFIRDRFVKGDRIILDGKDLCLHLINENLEKEYQAKINK